MERIKEKLISLLLDLILMSEYGDSPSKLICGMVLLHASLFLWSSFY